MQYICSKTGDDGSIYAATKQMMACNLCLMNRKHFTLLYTCNGLIQGISKGYCCFMAVIGIQEKLFFSAVPQVDVLINVFIPSLKELLHEL